MMPPRMLKTVIVAIEMHSRLIKARNRYRESKTKGYFLGQAHIRNETVS
jgi:hypothetical protein